MGKQDYYRQKLYEYVSDSEQEDDDHLIEFKNFLFKELLCNIKMIPFADIIKNYLTDDNVKFYNITQSNALDWLYTADRINIKNEIIYSFRFASPCNPDYYRTFIIKYHPCFILSYQTRHHLKGWYKYIGQELSTMVGNYLNINKIINKQNSYKIKIFVNNEYERLDIEFHFKSGDISKRITITFEPGYPAIV